MKYPKLMKALEHIAEDNGTRVKKSFSPEKFLQGMEKALEKLTEEELWTFCVGEHREQLAILETDPTLKTVSGFLNEAFDGAFSDMVFEYDR